ncbi:MAG: hypothetical protein ACE5Q6_00645 [Dehalococcoidia bacterium]
MTTHYLVTDKSASGWQQSIYAFLAEKHRRSGSRRTVETYSRMLYQFFGAMLALLDLGIVRITIPAMVVLGPLVLLQYAYCLHRQKYERTAWQYLQAEPLGIRAATLPTARTPDLVRFS